MRSAAEQSYALATDLVDYLVAKGVPFREAHGIMAAVTEYATAQGKPFGGLTLEEYRRFSDQFDQGVFDITVDSSVAARDVPGGTSPARVEEALARARALLET